MFLLTLFLPSLALFLPLPAYFDWASTVTTQLKLTNWHFQQFSCHRSCFSRHCQHSLTQHQKLGGVHLLRFFNTSLCFKVMAVWSLVWLHTFSWHQKLGGVRLLWFSDMSLHCQDMTEDDLSIFQVRTWTQHGKLGGTPFMVFWYVPSLPRYDRRWPFYFSSAYLDSAW